jgi:alanine dehydrogenase
LRIISAEDIDRVLTHEALVAALDDAFRAPITVPPRHHHVIPQPGRDGTLLLMPAWTQSEEPFLGCKMLTVFPDNAAIGRPALHAAYFLASGRTGELLAVIDGRILTAWRTAAASALAARYLARPDASHLVMVGAGTLAPYLVHAHAAVLPIRRVTLWNRSHGKAVSLAFALTIAGIEATVAEDLEAAVRDADIVSCATLSTQPLIEGAWLRKGTHVDLVGGFTPKMREADDEAVKRARLYVDTPAALKEAGDLVMPLRHGLIGKGDILGDLAGLCGGTVKGRRRATDITLFKSVGTALEDLTAAILVWRRLNP